MATTITKIQVKLITITRAEGLIEECDKPETATTFDHANGILSRWSETSPKDGSYDKCDFSVEYEDGENYTGRYDLVHWSKERADLAKHMLDHLTFYSGERCPMWLAKESNGVEKYRKIVAEQPRRRKVRSIFW